jgi:L-ascorbate metabolism protein UlaG (beta-lactamase superfamily)
MGMTIEAVPAYNDNHPRGNGNGYVVTIGGKRIYISGDTGNTPEMRALPNIDVAFLCVNLPFTMSVTDAAGALRAFRPRVVYPYHYRNSGGTFSDLEALRQMIGTDLGIELRARRWYN